MFNTTSRLFTLEDVGGLYDWIVEGVDPSEIVTMTDAELGAWVDTLIENSKEQDRYEIEERAASKTYPCYGYTTSEIFKNEEEYIAARIADMEEDYKVERGKVIAWIREQAQKEMGVTVGWENNENAAGWQETVNERGEKVMVNPHGKRLDFEAALASMEDDLREELHMRLAPCSEAEFFSAYATAHRERYGEDWELAKANPVW